MRKQLEQYTAQIRADQCAPPPSSNAGQCAPSPPHDTRPASTPSAPRAPADRPARAPARSPASGPTPGPMRNGRAGARWRSARRLGRECAGPLARDVRVRCGWGVGAQGAAERAGEGPRGDAAAHGERRLAARMHCCGGMPACACGRTYGGGRWRRGLGAGGPLERSTRRGAGPPAGPERNPRAAAVSRRSATAGTPPRARRTRPAGMPAEKPAGGCGSMAAGGGRCGAGTRARAEATVSRRSRAGQAEHAPADAAPCWPAGRHIRVRIRVRQGPRAGRGGSDYRAQRLPRAAAQPAACRPCR